MVDPHQLAQQAGSLDDRQWRVFLDDLSRARSERGRSTVDELPRDPTSRDQVAAWIARKHLAVDPGITDILYLPSDSPEREIRLIEANSLLTGSAGEEVTPIDFGLNVEGLSFKLLVLDVTPDQWKEIVEGKSQLPPGWILAGNQRFGYPSA
jgi:hypothetical protein